MESQKFKEANIVLGAGGNPNTHDIVACKCVESETDMPFIFAKWKLTEDELKIINENGGELFVGLMGNSWPPMFPTVHDPFEVHGFVVDPGGLPITMKYREEVYEMLKGLYFEDWMSDDYFTVFLEYMSKSFDFVNFSKTIDRGLKNGVSIESQLKDCERIMKKIMTNESLEKFKEKFEK